MMQRCGGKSSWQGKFQDSSVSNATPTDEEFKTFYENVIFPDFD